MIIFYAISSVLANRIRWWQIVRIPPVPIPNTVVKTYRGENTWRATAWKDSSLPASKLNKSEITWISSFAFLFENIYPLKDFNFRFFLEKTILARKPPASRKTWHLVTFCSAQSSRSWILLHTSLSLTGFCWRKIVVRFASCHFGVPLTLQPTQNPQHGRKDS